MPDTQAQAERKPRKTKQPSRRTPATSKQKASAYLPKPDSEHLIGEGEQAESVVNNPDLPAREPSSNGHNGTPDVEPTHEDIAMRAYELYIERGREPGREHEDWSRAERELRKK